jgi:hypothetical protein
MRTGKAWVHFCSALVGAVVGGLIVASLVPAGAETGDPVLAGMTNEAKTTTVLRGLSGAIPLGLVGDRGVPPLRVNSAVRVSRLNSDRVDDYHANGLARVAFCVEDDAPDGVDYACSMPFTAPANGYLVMSGSADTWRSTDGGDLLHCEFTLDGVQVIGSVRDFDLQMPGNQESDCATDAAMAVAAGAHTAVFQVHSVAPTTNLLDVGAYVIFIPFGGDGASW